MQLLRMQAFPLALCLLSDTSSPATNNWPRCSIVAGIVLNSRVNAATEGIEDNSLHFVEPTKLAVRLEDAEITHLDRL